MTEFKDAYMLFTGEFCNGYTDTLEQAQEWVKRFRDEEKNQEAGPYRVIIAKMQVMEG